MHVHVLFNRPGIGCLCVSSSGAARLRARFCTSFGANVAVQFGRRRDGWLTTQVAETFTESFSERALAEIKSKRTG